LAAAGQRRRQANFGRVIALAKKRGGACLSTTYVDSQTKLRWRCREGHEWEAVPVSISNGTWCPTCAGTRVLGIAAMRALAAERGGSCLSTQYVNVFTKLRWRCAKGHEWEAIPDQLRWRKSWCPVCARRSMKSPDDLAALAAKFGGTCLSSKVTTIHDKYTWRCRLGHVFSTTAHQVQQGHWCLACRGRGPGDLARMKRLARRRGGECLSLESVNATTKLLFRCRDGHEWHAVPGSIVQGSWCAKCGRGGHSTARLSIEMMQATAAERGGECLSKRYENAVTPLRWRCALGHVWRAPAARVRANRSWCPICAHRFPGTLDGMRRLAADQGGRCLSVEYNSHRTVLAWECASGHRFKAAGVAVKSGVWCPSCEAGKATLE
jgi:hypothetical protein